MTSDIVERSLVAEAVAEHWGERCPDFESGCPCCRAWAEFDQIERLRGGLLDCMQEAADHHRENEARAKIGGSDMAQRKAKAIVARSGVLLHNIKTIARAALATQETGHE